MKKLVEVSFTISILLGIQPVFANPPNSKTPETQSVPSAVNQMIELSKSWGFEITDCRRKCSPNRA